VLQHPELRQLQFKDSGRSRVLQHPQFRRNSAAFRPGLLFALQNPSGTTVELQVLLLVCIKFRAPPPPYIVLISTSSSRLLPRILPKTLPSTKNEQFLKYECNTRIFYESLVL
jgi:hypothetical protein